MVRKIIGLLVVGFVIALILPIGSATLQKIEKAAPEMNVNKPVSQLEITLKGGMGVIAFVKNTGTTDIINANISIVLDGPGIIWGSQKSTGAYLDIKAGKTQIIISPVFGFGVTNIEFTIDTTTQTASGKVLFWCVYGVK